MSQVDRTATHDDVDALLAADLITPQAAERASEILTEPANASIWARYGRWALLGLGVLQILAGIIFFFAANWSLLTKWERLGTVFALLIGCGLVAWLRHGTLVGQLCLTAATVLVGAFMAVFGQVYQTGADAWTLFANWAALTAIWVAVSRFWPLIILWMGVAQVGIFTFMTQMLVDSSEDPSLVCALFCLVMIGVASWISNGMPRWVLRVMTVNCAVMLVIPVLETAEGLLLTSALILVVLVAWSRRAITDLFVPAVALALAVLTITRLIVHGLGLDDILFVGFVIALQIALVTAWLRRQWSGSVE